IVKKEEVFIVGDSLADLLSAKKIGATFIGTLTGLKGENAKKELENNGADYIVNHVGNIRDILL
ncbi:HAD family hydrolase, partial [Staphylococcus warneri]